MANYMQDLENIRSKPRYCFIFGPHYKDEQILEIKYSLKILLALYYLFEFLSNFVHFIMKSSEGCDIRYIWPYDP